jgi:hypothetical protein
LIATNPFFGVASGLLGVAVQRYVEGRVHVSAMTTAAVASNTMPLRNLIVIPSPH